MLTVVLEEQRARALLAGAVYLMLYVLSTHSVWWASHQLQTRRGTAALLLRRWRGWSLLGRVVTLVLSVGYPFVLILNGIFSASDVGIAPIDWQPVLTWVLGISFGAVAWIALLWGSYWSKKALPHEAVVRALRRQSWHDLTVNALSHEATIATFRAALMPIVGPYWGVWLAVLGRLVASRANPAHAARLQIAGYRESAYLDWAIDWIAATLYAVSGSAWAAIFGRIACRAAITALLRWRAGRQAPEVLLVGLGEGDGQYDQRGEQPGGENANATQVR
ncbi:MAG: hypothetical protein ACYC5M_18165 [Anaerolineae bacterium]